MTTRHVLYAQLKIAAARKEGSTTKQAAIRKIAGRIINADVGLEAIIAHIKAARAKKLAAS